MAEKEDQTNTSWVSSWIEPSSQRSHPCWPQLGGPKWTSAGVITFSLLGICNYKFRPEVRLGTSLKLDCVD